MRYKLKYGDKYDADRVGKCLIHISKRSSPRDCAMTFCYPPRAISFLIILIFGIGICMALQVLCGRRIPFVRTATRGNRVSGEMLELPEHELTGPSSIPTHCRKVKRRLSL